MRVFLGPDARETSKKRVGAEIFKTVDCEGVKNGWRGNKRVRCVPQVKVDDVPTP